jgi:hypothetical protein
LLGSIRISAWAPSLGPKVLVTALVDADRTGGGIPYADDALHDAQGDFNRPAFVNLLAADCFTPVQGFVDRPERPGARAAEIGCGEGWAAISLARAFPDLILTSVWLRWGQPRSEAAAPRPSGHNWVHGGPRITGEQHGVTDGRCPGRPR